MEVIFRAKTKKQDFLKETKNIKFIDNTWYAIGYEHPIGNKTYLRNTFLPDVWDIEEIDPTTLAIGRKYIQDKKTEIIFFALKNERGGDIVEFEGNKGVAKVGRYDFFINPLSMYHSKFYNNDGSTRFDYDDLKVIGIQE